MKIRKLNRTVREPYPHVPHVATRPFPPAGRTLLDEPVAVRVRRTQEASEGRGLSWADGTLRGFDATPEIGQAAIVWMPSGGWRTLQASLWQVESMLDRKWTSVYE